MPRLPYALLLSGSIDALVLAALLLAAPALAAWPHDSAVNVPVSAATDNQASAVSCSDGAGGAFIAWEDSRLGDSDIFAQHLTAAGAVASGWAPNGNAICIVSTDQRAPCIVADGSGGAIIAWRDPRGGDDDIYAQRVDASGTWLWTSGGVRLSTSIKNEVSPVIVSDGSGGAIVAWELVFTPGTDIDIYANRVNSAGSIAPGWSAGGLAIRSTSFDEAAPCIAADGAGGGILAWIDNRNGGSNFDIYSIRVTGAGAVAGGWSSSGVALCNATASQLNPGIIADGAGGVIAFWEDHRAGNTDVYANRVTGLGAIASGWLSGGPDGAAVVARASTQYQPVAVSDGAGGALFAWTDQRSDGGDIYARHLTGAGVPAAGWPADGRALCTAANYQTATQIVADGSGGAIVCWQDGRSGDYDIYMQRVTGSGNIPAVWTTDGVAVCTAAATQEFPTLVSDQAGGAIAAWGDLRSDPFGDIYAQRIDHFGPLGNPEPAINAITDVKGDQGGQVLLKWNASYLDADPNYAVGAYWIWRQVPATLAARAAEAGASWVDESGVVEAGVGADGAWGSHPANAYATGRLFMRPAGADAASANAWEYLASQPGSGFSQYSYVAPTAADSVTGHNPYTLFMVQARAASGIAFWNSPPDSGYSVDNLPPLPPAPFTGAYASDATSLHWGVSLEADFASYRLYRGSTSDFVPGPGNLIAAQPDTGFVDPGLVANWYKLSAVDAHGNESAFAVLGPSGTLDAPGPLLPHELALDARSANPARSGAHFRLALPQAARVRLALYDAGGRVVKVLADGAWPAGEHMLEWNGKDRTGNAAAGVYFVRLEAAGRVLTRRVVLLH